MSIQKVSTEAILKGQVRKEFAWNLISDFVRYPQIMSSVDSVEIIDRRGHEGKSEWFVTIEEAPFTWIERDFFDEKNFEITFELIDGDFESFSGRWKVEDYQNEGIKVFFDVEYSLGIPVIENVLGHILKEKMKNNIDSMIHAIKDELTKAQSEERKYKRHEIGTFNNIVLNGNSTRVFIVNLSQKGIMFYYDGEFDSLNVSLQVGNFKIEGTELYNDIKHKNTRIIFQEPLKNYELDEMLKVLIHMNVRECKRTLIEKNISIISENKNINIHLINFSQKGILFKYSGILDKIGEYIEICGEKIKVKNIYHDIGFKSVRVAFDKTLENDKFDKLLKTII